MKKAEVGGTARGDIHARTPRFRSRVFRRILDAIYLGGAAASLALGILRGRPGRTWDHLRRRAFAFDPAPREPIRPGLWLHGVSVGEVLAARGLLASFAARHPDWQLIISSSTRLGVEAAARAWPQELVISFPLDFTSTVGRAFRRLRPAAIVVVEHDLWPNLLARAEAEHVPVVLLNARLSERTLRSYRRLSRFFSWPPKSLASICAADEESAARFRSLGFSSEEVHVTGNLKFDNPPPAGADRIRAELGYTSADWVLVAASTHEGEEEAALDALLAVRERTPGARLVLAPRRIERTEAVERLVLARDLRVVRWSGFERRSDEDVLLVDTIGDLARLTALGDLVFVGGTLAPIGGHNVIEPASLARPIIVGPHYRNARAVVDRFRDDKAIRVVSSAADFVRAVRELEANRDEARALGARAAGTVAANLGATERALARLEEAISRAPRN